MNTCAKSSPLAFINLFTLQPCSAYCYTVLKLGQTYLVLSCCGRCDLWAYNFPQTSASASSQAALRSGPGPDSDSFLDSTWIQTPAWIWMHNLDSDPGLDLDPESDRILTQIQAQMTVASKSFRLLKCHFHTVEEQLTILTDSCMSSLQKLSLLWLL